MPGTAGVLLRLFLFQDPVPRGEARAALGSAVEDWLALGVLASVPGDALVSPFVIGLLDDRVILSDTLTHGQDAVMGFGHATIDLARAATPQYRVGHVLDLGCGAGTVAFALSRHADQVVATDLNPRAITLGRINAAINGIANVEFRVGSLFDPVADERFDVIASQPPYVAMPDGATGARFLYGGTRGDEIALALLEGLGAHLTAGGRAVLYVDWPAVGDTPLDQRLRAALRGAALDLLVLKAPDVSLDVHALAYAAGTHPVLDDAFEHEVHLRRAHFDRHGIRAIQPTITVVTHAEGSGGETIVLPIDPFGTIAPTSQRIDKLLLARSLVRCPERLLQTRVRVPEGTRLVQEQIGPGADVPSRLFAHFSAQACVAPMELTVGMLHLITVVHESSTVEVGLRRLAEEQEIPDSEIGQTVPAVQEALTRGLLEVAEL